MKPANPNVDAYLRTKATTASPEELRLMLLDGAVKFARQGHEGLLKKDFEAVFAGFSRARDIVLELVNSMRPDVAPDLCKRLSGLYMFIYRELIEASMNKEPERAAKAIELLEYERETWALLMQKMASERSAADANRAAARVAHPGSASPPPAQPEPSAYTPISVQA